MAFMMALLALLGHMVWGEEGLLTLLMLALALSLLHPIVSPWLVLRLYRARPLHPAEVPALYDMLAELARRAELPAVPTLCHVQSDLVNAFTVGGARDAVIGVTDGLLRNLQWREIAGVLAHEISHIRSGDLRVMGLADLMSRLARFLSLFGQLLLLFNLPLLWAEQVQVNWWALALLIFAPHIILLAQLGLSRTREFHADLNAAWLTGDPEGLASALAKIEYGSRRLMAILFPGVNLPEPSWLRTHPPTEERIRRLMELRQHPARPVWDPLREPGRPAWMRQVTRRPRYHWSGLWY
ncbi:M48 family metalloprotease [Methylococcus geothermalis]|uniref:M48 family metalloprotease n=1 Tax=Methylococcus geothermalis TaxID=2681310 RepID=A0A858QC03_9GAMM|nr:M48 family metalloprotease [Methylococcus geothermalis]